MPEAFTLEGVSQLGKWSGQPMADYYTRQQLAQRLGITESTIEELHNQGLLQCKVKNGRVFFSSQQAYRLQIALRWARKDKLDLKKAFACVEEHWLARGAALKN